MLWIKVCQIYLNTLVLNNTEYIIIPNNTKHTHPFQKKEKRNFLKTHWSPLEDAKEGKKLGFQALISPSLCNSK